MRSPLEQSVLETIRDERMLAPGDRAGVAVSGGADSIALLRLLEKLRGELGITLAVVHFDHSLRGKESEGDSRFVCDLAHLSGLEFILGKDDVAGKAEQHGWNLEDAARRIRYAFFKRVVEEKRVTRICVAHTADDQAETVLAHVIRGTGPTGLAGIYPIAGPIVRPLLKTRRQELRQFLKELGQEWREDATNQDLHRLRARIRAQLLPQLETDFSRQIVPRLCDLARLSQEEENFWAELVEQRYCRCAQEQGGDLTMKICDLMTMPGVSARETAHLAIRTSTSSAPWRPLTERLIRRLYEKVRGDRRELSSRHVEQVIHLVTESSSGRRVQLPGGIQAKREFGRLVFSHARTAEHSEQRGSTAAEANTYEYVVRFSGQGTTAVSVPELGSRFRLKVIDWPVTASDTKRGVQALDADLLGTPLVLRNWRPGDAYRPCGRRQVRKLKDMFRTGRVPSRERGRWPVLESEGRVIWTRGMPPAAEFSAREGTRAGVVIEEDRI